MLIYQCSELMNTYKNFDAYSNKHSRSEKLKELTSKKRKQVLSKKNSLFLKSLGLRVKKE